MRLGVFGGLVAALIIVALIVAYGTLFTVYQTRQALVVRLGQPIRVVTAPGLNYKIPLIDTVIPVDKRILDLENPAQEVIASDQKRLVVDAFARYRIVDALKYYQSVGSIEGANSRLSTLLNSALRRVLGEATLTQVVRDQRQVHAAADGHQDRSRADGARHRAPARVEAQRNQRYGQSEKAADDTDRVFRVHRVHEPRIGAVAKNLVRAGDRRTVRRRRLCFGRR